MENGGLSSSMRLLLPAPACFQGMAATLPPANLEELNCFANIRASTLATPVDGKPLLQLFFIVAVLGVCSPGRLLLVAPRLFLDVGQLLLLPVP